MERAARDKTAELIAESAHHLRILDTLAQEAARVDEPARRSGYAWRKLLWSVVAYPLLIVLGSMLGVLLLLSLGMP